MFDVIIGIAMGYWRRWWAPLLSIVVDASVVFKLAVFDLSSEGNVAITGEEARQMAEAFVRENYQSFDNKEISPYRDYCGNVGLEGFDFDWDGNWSLHSLFLNQETNQSHHIRPVNPGHSLAAGADGTAYRHSRLYGERSTVKEAREGNGGIIVELI